MNLSGLISEGAAVELQTLSEDRELSIDIQQRLIDLGMLDPPADGRFGPQSRAALRRFGERVGIEVDPFVKADIAQQLLEARAEDLYPLNLDATDFPSRVLQYMQRHGYWIARPRGYLNVVYVEGADENGRFNNNRPNEFNDRRLLISIEDGRPKMVGNWESTTEPGRYYTNNPPPLVRRLGVARICLGQFKAWTVGTHHGLSGRDNHEALVQSGTIGVCRDLDKNYRRENDRIYNGLFSINQHSGHGARQEDIGMASAGCLVGRTDAGHRQFMQLLKSDSRYGVNTGYMFMTTVISGEQLTAELG